MEFIIKFLATGCYLGYLPYAPGTFGTLAGVALFMAFAALSPLYYAVSTVLLFLLASAVSGKAEKIFNKKDAAVIVIDEVTGFIVTMAMIKPSALSIISGFILFRFFDIVKVWPASYFNNKNGGLAVVLDDVAAGIYANILLRILLTITT